MAARLGPGRLRLFNAHLEYADGLAAFRWARISAACRIADLEDLRSFARLGLLHAVRRWRPGRARFRTYARPRILGAIGDGLRNFEWWGRGAWRRGMSRMEVFSLDAPFAKDHEITLHDSIAAVDDGGLERVAGRDLLDWLFRQLPPKQRIVMSGLRCGLKQAEIGLTMGLTDSRVSQLYTEALAACRSLLRRSEI